MRQDRKCFHFSSDAVYFLRTSLGFCFRFCQLSRPERFACYSPKSCLTREFTLMLEGCAIFLSIRISNIKHSEKTILLRDWEVLVNKTMQSNFNQVDPGQVSLIGCIVSSRLELAGQSIIFSPCFITSHPWLCSQKDTQVRVFATFVR